ncbi:MAG: CocE/NonD family hydrolase [Stenotrophobium sp.]
MSEKSSIPVMIVHALAAAFRGLPGRAGLACLLLLALAGCGAGSAPVTASSASTPADPPQVSQNVQFTASDGVSLATQLGGAGPLPLVPRPLVVEFGPYDQASCNECAGPDYNYLYVEIRGTGKSDGAFDALGPRSQQDVVEVLNWACQQPWSNGVAGVYGFSASAIMIYNSLHLQFPSCVKAAVLMAGTHELYRDLLYPGGIPNLLAGTYVLVGIGGPAASEAVARLESGNPFASLVDPTVGMFSVGLDYLLNPTLDDWWLQRGMRGNVNHLPTLMITSFFDVEPRGPFQAFQELTREGANPHLLVVGAHDGAPAGTENLRMDEQTKWYDHYLKGVANNVDQQPRVQMLMADGDRLKYLAGDFERYNATDWPVPGTAWTALALDPAPSDSGALSINNGSLSLTAPSQTAVQSYPEIVSLPTATDPHTTGVIGGVSFGGYSFNTFLTAIPQLANMSLVEPMSLTYTTKPFASDVLSVGPASLEIQLSSTAPETDIFAVICDVAPDGSSNPVATGRLRSAYPDIDPAKSLKDANGNIVQPYGVYSAKNDAMIGTPRLYHVEFWPIGNRFKKGDRLRLDLVGVSAYHLPSLPGIDSVTVGGASGSRLLLPVIPGIPGLSGSDLSAALQ